MQSPFRCADSATARTERRALTLIELLVIVLILSLIVVALIPRRPNRVTQSQRLVCGSNVKGLGTAMKIHANDYDEEWPVAPFDETRIGAIDYTLAAGGGSGSPRSPARGQSSTAGAGGTRQLTVTRTLWMFVRSGDITPRSFICPSSGDSEKNEQYIDGFYDFAGPQHVSYGFQVPYGPANSRASEHIDPRAALAADKGPYVDASVAVPTEVPADPRARFDELRTYNSRNHGGEGQNVLFADGHANFERHAFIGVDGDNIYTVATGHDQPEKFKIGESPWKRSAHPFAPPDRNGKTEYTTDSLIYP